jgi:hypothetical protein
MVEEETDQTNRMFSTFQDFHSVVVETNQTLEETNFLMLPMLVVTSAPISKEEVLEGERGFRATLKANSLSLTQILT